MKNPFNFLFERRGVKWANFDGAYTDVFIGILLKSSSHTLEIMESL